ncbi:FKBP-type peptidyl-prolyl cis-trans isomerase [Reichenbachiella ulvae]|uniref:Peptidyl-prolyl cis-trans isomerase n=1 Tax=Reichenbachiella ulvae TaxID=2980104 RepID=A0ABT3CZ70_9BACT|nr:FKBP-type peptidyl-prolyl cis-trans isomerase [Reichenbachiella ulvae]MCV9388861.1 FKBP-type peptidyl-prolyl cis-trans isomerase [Reichenbachiella ulvae]
MKLNKLLMLSAVAVATIVSSCSQKDTATTKSGVVVSYEKRGEEVLKDSSILLINMKYITATDSTLFDSEERGGPITIPYNVAQWDTTKVFYEVLGTINVGDSVAFQISANELFQNTFGQPVPPSIPAESMIQFNLGLEDQMTMEEFQDYRVARMEKEQQKMMEEQKELTAEQGVAIDSALAANNLEAITTESGLRYVITEEGDGAMPEKGNVVVVHYNGTLLDGTKFDSSYDRDQPFEFPLGQGRVIPGWDEGIALLKVGTKATLYVPSALAYGPRGAGAVIKPNSILKFDVELLDIKK